MYSWEVEFLSTPPPSLTLSFHKPSDAELTYFLGAEIQKDERRFTSYFFLQEFWHLANQPLFLVFDIFISFHTFILLFLQLTHPVCHVFPSLLIFLFSRIFLSYSRKFLSLFLFISHRFVCRFLLKFL